MNKKNKIPNFKNLTEEKKFWSKFDLANSFKKDDFKPVFFPNLKPSSRPISIRLPANLIMRLKERANSLDMPYQSLIKSYISKSVSEKI